ncbi:hypothetical protein B7454_08125 [Staphylococcus lugdunensis]|nr:hypothetical protein B7454_08125 [Staphylococcus lugdunensis]ARJ16382.1 hypothetical protein B6N54_07195 [Staphylococcus lugdunensis]ARJ29780.1 hypothetical protein B6N84_07210 [Staphylococcus lugdunensis]
MARLLREQDKRDPNKEKCEKHFVWQSKLGWLKLSPKKASQQCEVLNKMRHSYEIEFNSYECYFLRFMSQARYFLRSSYYIKPLVGYFNYFVSLIISCRSDCRLITSLALPSFKKKTDGFCI